MGLVSGGPPTAAEVDEYQHLVTETFSGVLSVDEVYDGQYAILCTRDPPEVVGAEGLEAIPRITSGGWPSWPRRCWRLSR